MRNFKDINYVTYSVLHIPFFKLKHIIFMCLFGEFRSIENDGHSPLGHDAILIGNLFSSR
jgi:hypothetical protein